MIAVAYLAVHLLVGSAAPAPYDLGIMGMEGLDASGRARAHIRYGGLSGCEPPSAVPEGVDRGARSERDQGRSRRKRSAQEAVDPRGDRHPQKDQCRKQMQGCAEDLRSGALQSVGTSSPAPEHEQRRHGESVEEQQGRPDVDEQGLESSGQGQDRRRGRLGPRRTADELRRASVARGHDGSGLAGALAGPGEDAGARPRPVRRGAHRGAAGRRQAGRRRL